MTTSRGRLLDAVMLIADDIALASHYQELINAHKSKGELDKIADYELLLQGSVSRRREVMRKIEQAYTEKTNHDLRCALKHSIAIYQYATEVSYATEGFDHIQQSAYESMIACLSLFVGEEMVTCSRCLEDKLRGVVV